jgi:hypothetical protein
VIDARRAEACKLDPAFKLVELEEAVAFVHDRGMLTLTPCCALPSLFGACHEEAHSPGKKGYGTWPKTRWWWGGAVAATDGVTVAKLHGGKNVYLSSRVTDLVDPLCREELARARDGAFGEDAQRLVELLVTAGPATTDEVKDALGFEAKAYQRARSTLERRGAIVSTGLTAETGGDGGHLHTSELRAWDHAPATPAPSDPRPALLHAVVAAAVVISEKEARRALRWDLPAEADGVERMPDGRLAVTGAVYS